MPNFFAKAWRGWAGEEEMTEEDWILRGHQQAMAMTNCLDPFLSSPGEDGHPTGGEYNGDYPQSWHDLQNAKLDSDEYFEAQVDQNLRTLRQASRDGDPY